MFPIITSGSSDRIRNEPVGTSICDMLQAFVY